MATLMEIYPKYAGDCFTGTDKGTSHSYIEVYDELLSPRIGKGTTLLELGVATGKSLLMWNEYLVNGIIHGVDLIPMPKVLQGIPSIIFHQVDICDKQALEKEFAGLTFDVIIDDAQHIIEQQVLAISVLMSKLRNGGLYIIEDATIESLPLFLPYGKVTMLDLRNIKQRYDDVLILIPK